MADNKVAVITGVTGQDGSYLAELLLGKGYEVIGVVRRSSSDTTGRIKHLDGRDGFNLVQGDVTDPNSINFVLHSYHPDEFYNLAAQSHVKTSFEQPDLTFNVNARGVLNILEAIRHYSPWTRLYQASTSEMFGKNFVGGLDNKYQDENTPFAPQSPYAISKVAAHHYVQLYREAYSIHGSCGILFNHESERRGEEFVTRKITKWIGDFTRWRLLSGNYKILHTHDNDHIATPLNKNNDIFTYPKLRLGNLEPRRDWGHAKDYVNAMWLMLQQDEPDDYVVSTKETHSVEEFLIEAFKCIKIDNYQPYVVQDPKFMRPAEVNYLLGDSTKIREKLGWKPTVSFPALVSRMVEHDIKG